MTFIVLSFQQDCSEYEVDTDLLELLDGGVGERFEDVCFLRHLDGGTGVWWSVPASQYNHLIIVS